MSKDQVNKLLYLLSLLSLSVLLVELLTTPYVWDFFRIAPSMLLISILGTILVILFIAAPFLKQNKILLLVPLACILGDSYINSITSIYGYFFTDLDLMSEGVVPGILISLSYFMMETSGLLFLGLRTYGYIKEHRAGLYTKF